MNLNKMLPCMLDDAFQDILENDPVLNELEKLKRNDKDQFLELMILLNNKVKICGVEINCITPAIWCFLYTIKSPFVIQEKSISELDIDVLMYILNKGLSNISDNLFKVANGFCKRKNLNYFVVEKDLLDFIKISFRAIQMFPQSVTTEKTEFNVDWMTKIIAMVCKMTNHNSSYIMNKMSLTECFYYVAQNARENDIHHTIKRRNPAEINEAIYKRTFELGEEYYKKNYEEKSICR